MKLLATALCYGLAALAPVVALILIDLVLFLALPLLPAPPGRGVILGLALLRLLLAVGAIALTGRIAAPGDLRQFLNVMTTGWVALFVANLLLTGYGRPILNAFDLRTSDALYSAALLWLAEALPGAGFAAVWWLRRNSVYQGIQH